jgi:uncharacterized protein (DUF697 family)
MSVNKKKFPNVIMHPIGGMREAAAAAAGSREWRGAAAADERVVAARSGPVGEVVEETRASAMPITTTLARAARTSADTNVTKRQARARAIVARHAAYSAVGGIVPIPVASVAGITTIIIRMVKMLSDLYGVPFERDRARAIIVGLVGGTMPTGFATVATSTLFYAVPSGALMGLVVSSITAIACTRGIGQIFIEHFESGATLHDLSIEES